MVQERHKTKSSRRSRVLGFLLINIIPLGGLVALVWGVQQGRVSLDDLPEGVGRNGLYFGVVIALLIVTASLVLPGAHRIARQAQGRLLWSRDVRSHAGFARRCWEWILWLPLQVAFRLFALLRLVLTLLSIVLILAALLFMIRLVKPRFMEAELNVNQRMEQVESWVGSLEWPSHR